MQREEGILYWADEYLALAGNLRSKFLNASSVIVVAPSASAADALRSIVSNSDIRNQKVQTLTFANFIRKLMEEIIARNLLQGELARKSEIYLELGLFWNSNLKEFDFHLFETAFKTYTDLRSYGFSDDILEVLISKFENPLDQLLKIFHKYFGSKCVYDEHSLIADISNLLKLHNFDFIQEAEIYFWGFSRLSALQVDFVKSLSIRNTTQIILPSYLKNKLTPNDWPCWVDHNLIDSIHEVAEFTVKPKAKVAIAPRLELSEVIKQVFESQKIQNVVNLDISKNPDLISAFPESNLSFKLPTDFFNDILCSIKLDLKKLLDQSQISEVKQLKQFFESRIKKNLISEKNFRELTVIQEYLKALANCQEHSFNHFMNFLLAEIVSLNLPRVNLAAASDVSKTFLGAEDLFKSKSEESLLLTIFEGESWLALAKDNFPSNVTSDLRDFGPVESKHFQLYFKTALVRELVTRASSFLVIEEALLEDKLLFEIFNDAFEFTPFMTTAGAEINFKYTCSKSNHSNGTLASKRISATRLQTYLDCNYKYYLKYIKRVSPSAGAKSTFSESDKGIIAHAMIAKTCNQLGRFDSAMARNLFDPIFSQVAAELGKSDDAISSNIDRVEIYYLVENGINSISQLLRNLKLEDFKFEFSFSNELSEGSIDLWIKTSQGEIILDMKKSSFSIPSDTEVRSFKKIQLPFYLKNIDTSNLIAFGYVNLKRPKESKYYQISGSSDLFSHLGLSKLGMEIKDFLKQYENFEQTQREKMVAEQEFFPNPQSKDVCNYCDFKIVCPRGAL